MSWMGKRDVCSLEEEGSFAGTFGPLSHFAGVVERRRGVLDGNRHAVWL